MCSRYKPKLVRFRLADGSSGDVAASPDGAERISNGGRAQALSTQSSTRQVRTIARRLDILSREMRQSSQDAALTMLILSARTQHCAPVNDAKQALRRANKSAYLPDW